MSKEMYRPGEVLDMAGVQHLAIGDYPTGIMVSADDWYLLNLLRNGDEAAFVSLVDKYHSTMLHLAMIYVATRMVAEEVVQETWIAVLEGLSRFESRSSLKTWIFHILINQAKTRALREGRSIPFSSFADLNLDVAESALDSERFRPSDAPKWAGGWVSFPASWEELPEERLLSKETQECIERTIETLSPVQREIIVLRDVEGWSSEETCHFLGLTEGNQRVLLHRARAKVRNALEKYFAEK